jgi:hypothetical protein
MAHVLFYIEEAGAAGIITSKLRDAVSFGHTLLKDALDALESEGKIYKKKEGSNTIRYFLTGGLIAGLQKAAASQSRRRLAGL